MDKTRTEECFSLKGAMANVSVFFMSPSPYRFSSFFHVFFLHDFIPALFRAGS